MRGGLTFAGDGGGEYLLLRGVVVHFRGKVSKRTCAGMRQWAWRARLTSHNNRVYIRKGRRSGLQLHLSGLDNFRVHGHCWPYWARRRRAGHPDFRCSARPRGTTDQRCHRQGRCKVGDSWAQLTRGEQKRSRAATGRAFWLQAPGQIGPGARARYVVRGRAGHCPLPHPPALPMHPSWRPALPPCSLASLAANARNSCDLLDYFMLPCAATAGERHGWLI